MNKTYQCVIRIVSPVHIGCGEVYEPTGFVVDEKANCLIQFDPLGFILDLNETDRDRLSRICCQGNLSSIIQLYKFFQGRPATGRKIKLAHGFVDHYQETLKIRETDNKKIAQELNRFTIERTAFQTFDNRPYLPGSAIKGALRTGYLNELCNGRKMDKKEIEKELLSYHRIEEDPFSLVKISDFRPAGPIDTKIVYAVNRKKKISELEPNAMHQIFEIIEPGATFIGDITVRDAPQGSPVRNPILLDKLLNGSHKFFKTEHARERMELSGVNIPEVIKIETNQEKMLIRIGRHSGAESLTIKGNRDIRIMRGKEKPVFIDHATTIWLASDRKKVKDPSNLIPFGWSCIQVMDSDVRKELSDREAAYQAVLSDQVKEMENLSNELLRQKEAERQAELIKQAKIEMEKQEEEQRQKELDTMTPEDRELYDIFDSGSDKDKEQQVVTLFNRLDNMAPDHKIKSAQRIKAYYIESKKWNKKEISNKQQEKVKKLKSILGEN